MTRDVDIEVPVIAIDGPSGAGKGTISRLVAEKTGFHLLDSGAIYRVTALAALNAGVNLDHETAVTSVARTLDVRFVAAKGDTHIFLGGADVSDAIRTERAGMAASKVAALPLVRQTLLQRQRDFAAAPGLVADGRDMGTVVFPNALLKIFLTASAEERARRRVQQLAQKGLPGDFVATLADIEARDLRDSTRETAPLLPAPDAVMLDSTGLSIEQVVQEVLNHFQRLRGAKTIGE